MAGQASGAGRRPSRMKMLQRLLRSPKAMRRESKGDGSALPKFRSDIGVSGWLVEASAERIVGRAYRPDRLDQRLELALYDGERFVVSMTADHRRAEMVKQGIGDGRYGFGFRIPHEMRDGEMHELDIRIARSAQSLLTRPIRLRLDPPSDGGAAPASGPQGGGQGPARRGGGGSGSPPAGGFHARSSNGDARAVTTKRGNGAAKGEPDEAAAVALIAASPLFDAAWYLAEYPEVARFGIDPALHYVRHGGTRRFKPSLYFDPAYYLEAEPDLAAAGGNPLIHYLTIGRAEGRAPMALFAPVPPPPIGRPAPIVDAPAGLDEPDTPWVRQAAVAQGGGLRFGDVALGAAGRDLGLAPLHAYCRLFDLDPAQTIRLPGNDGSEAGAGPYASEAIRCFGPMLAAGRARLVDGWFADELTIRLRLGPDAAAAEADRVVVRGFQASAADAATLALCGEALLPAAGPAFLDLALADRLLPVVLVVADPAGEVRELGLLPFPSLLRGGLHHAELVAAAERPSPIDDLRAYSDALLRMIEAGPASEIGRILVRRQGATGTEPIFSQSMTAWLARIFRVAVELDASPAADPDEGAAAFLRERLGAGARLLGDGARRAAPTLTLPPDAVPTIGALALRHLPPIGASAVGSFLIAEAPSGRPRWSVTLPALDGADIALQPATAVVPYPLLQANGPEQAGAASGAVGLQLAIRHRRFAPIKEAALAMPRAPDAEGPVLRKGPSDETPKIAALILSTDAVATGRLLESLAFQSLAAALRVEVRLAAGAAADAGEIGHALERLFPGRSRLVHARTGLGADIAAAFGDEATRFVLVARDSVVAHDRRTLETLLVLAGEPGVASAGCAVLHETPGKKGGLGFRSGGYFPSHVSFLAAPHLVLAAPDCQGALSEATYPVAGNAFDFVLLPRRAAPICAAMEPSSFGGARPDVAFALAALAEGCRHLCTSAVRVTAFGDRPPAETIDPLGDAFLPPAGWEAILSRVTVLRAL